LETPTYICGLCMQNVDARTIACMTGLEGRDTRCKHKLDFVIVTHVCTTQGSCWVADDLLSCLLMNKSTGLIGNMAGDVDRLGYFMPVHENTSMSSAVKCRALAPLLNM